MNIHLQPLQPSIPSIFSIAKARRPEKVPPKAPAEKNIARRVCNSKQQYQVVNKYEAAGKKPVSVRPRKKSGNDQAFEVLDDVCQSHDLRPRQ